MNHTSIWNSVRERKPKSPLIFIHTPKCAGSYASEILKDLNIINKHHVQANKNEGINFTIIRDPVDRFESLLNYRLSEPGPRKDWPKNLYYAYTNKNISLNEIVSKMTIKDIFSFNPFKTLTFWSKDVDIFITIEQLEDFLKFFGYSYNPNKYERKNVSTKTRGNFDDTTKERLRNLFYYDNILFNKVKNRPL